MQYWEIIADKLSAAGWTWGYCSAVTLFGWRGGMAKRKPSGSLLPLVARDCES